MALTHWEHAEEKVPRAACMLETQSLKPPSNRRPAPLKDAGQVTSLLRLNSYLFESSSSTCDGDGNAGCNTGAAVPSSGILKEQESVLTRTGEQGEGKRRASKKQRWLSDKGWFCPEDVLY